MEKKRRSIRLKGWDYKSNGLYFVTIAVQDRIKMFWNVGAESYFCPNENTSISKVGLNEIGLMIEKSIKEIPKHYPNFDIDEYVVMPDHIHLIIKIVGVESNFGPDKLSLPDLIQRFKILTTNKYIEGIRTKNWPKFDKRIWQRNYFEKIIRDNGELKNVRNYIKKNPEKLYKRADMGIRSYEGKGVKIAIIGSREMSPYGRRMIEKLVPDIEKRAQIISGKIRGCNNYVAKIAKDYIEIKVEQGNFEKFNHDLAVSADKLLIIEAGKGSGTILAAKEFLDLGKEVYCVPGRLGDAQSMGCNWLIQNGAGLLMAVEDILL